MATQKRAVNFGAGKHGRGFMGKILSASGYHITFVDTDTHLVDLLHELQAYECHVIGAEKQVVQVQNVDAYVNGSPELPEIMASCDVITTSIGLTQLPDIARSVADCITTRAARKIQTPLHIIAAENCLRASTFLSGFVADFLSPDARAYARAHVAFVDCEVDQIVPSVERFDFTAKATPADELRAVMEEFYELALDRRQVKAGLDLVGATLCDDLQAIQERKYFTVNTAHAVAAYLGHVKGYETILESINDPDIEAAVKGAMQETAGVLIPRYNLDPEAHADYIERTIARFRNPHIKDTVKRVGRDPLRKLEPTDRLVAPITWATEEKLPCTNLCRGLAAALRYSDEHDQQALRLQSMLHSSGLIGVLKELLPPPLRSTDCEVVPMIEQFYEGMLAQKPVHMRKVATESSPLSAVGGLEYPAAEEEEQPPAYDRFAIHFGAGKIGRGFIGLILSNSGYHVTFADVDKHMVNLLSRLQTYKVHVVADRREQFQVTGVTAMLSTDEALVDKLATADIVTTAVGVNILPRIAPTVAQGLKLRRLKGIDRPLNIIACENAVRATTALKAHVLQHLEEEDVEFVKAHVGFVDSAVDRIVPSMDQVGPHHTQSEADEVRVVVEQFFEWDVDQNQFAGQLPPLDGVTLCDNLQAYVERKLFTLNTGHAITAYLGFIRGYGTILQSINDPEVEAVVKGAMEESAQVLVKRYGFDPEAHAAYIARILQRFKNPYLLDEVMRVGRDPLRKLDVSDRLIKPLLGTLEYGTPHDNLCKGIGAAMRYANPGDPQAVKLQEMMAQFGPRGTLAHIIPLVDKKIDSETMQRILNEYDTAKVKEATSG